MGGITLIFATTVFIFRDQVFTAFVADQSVLALGATISGGGDGGDDHVAGALNS